MAKNRKNKSAAIRFGPAIKALLMCSLFVLSGVGYVWQKSLIADLDRNRKASEQALETLKDQNKKLREKWAERTTPERLRKLNTGLELPALAQVVWLFEPAEPPPAHPPAAIQRYAARP